MEDLNALYLKPNKADKAIIKLLKPKINSDKNSQLLRTGLYELFKKHFGDDALQKLLADFFDNNSLNDEKKK